MNKEINVLHQNEKVLLKNIPVLRQAFVIASTLILLGVVLGYVVDDRWLLLPVMVAGGLMFSGLVGWCPMAWMLGKIPWNKQ